MTRYYGRVNIGKMPPRQAYAYERLGEIEERKLEELKRRYTTPGRELTPKEKLTAFLNGQLPRKRSVCTIGLFSYTNVSDIYDIDALDTADKINQVEYDKAAAKVVAKAISIRDHIMLKDYDTAADLIAQYEKEKV